MSYAINANLSVRTVGGELFILNRETSDIHSFNRTGTFIWEQLCSATPLERIPGLLALRFETSQEQAGRDLADFLDALERGRLITR